HNLRTGEVVGHLRMPTPRLAAISPGGTFLAVSDGSKRVVVVNALTGQARFELPQDSPVTSLAFGPGRHLIATGGEDGTAWLWKIATGKQRFVRHGHAGAVRDVAFSPRADYVASASSDSTARVFSVSDGTPVAVMSGHSGPVTQVAFSPDGTRIVTASEDGTARVWKAATGAQWPRGRGGRGGGPPHASSPTAPTSSPAATTAGCGSGTRCNSRCSTSSHSCPGRSSARSRSAAAASRL